MPVTATPASATPSPHRIDGMRPDAPSRAPFGPYAVGRETLRLTNPDVVNAVALETGEGPARYDRPMTLSLFYPAHGPVEPSPMDSLLRDGTTRFQLLGQSAEDAPVADGGTGFPLIIISHGWPGNRFLLSHLAENLATKGYVVAALDHTDSTYDDQREAFCTVVHRPVDLHFALDTLAEMAADGSHPVLSRTTTGRVGVIGYSMGGYGVLAAQGGLLSPAALSNVPEAFAEALTAYTTAADNSDPALEPDPRIAAMISIAPWGRQVGLWEAAGLARIATPLMVVGGGEDHVSGYETGIRQIWKDCSGTDRALLTFDNARHNAAAPIGPPAEALSEHPEHGWLPYEHYADPVWDSTRMHNIMQHHATGFFDHYIRGQADAPDLAAAAEEEPILGTRFEFLAAGG